MGVSLILQKIWNRWLKVKGRGFSSDRSEDIEIDFDGNDLSTNESSIHPTVTMYHFLISQANIVCYNFFYIVREKRRTSNDLTGIYLLVLHSFFIYLGGQQSYQVGYEPSVHPLGAVPNINPSFKTFVFNDKILYVKFSASIMNFLLMENRR